MKGLIAIALVVTGLLAVSVYRAKEGAQNSELNIVQLKREIAAEKEELRVLKAEEAHLSRPERIGPLAAEKLGMGPVRPEQITGETALQKKLSDTQSAAEVIGEQTQSGGWL
ncbi:cell division protein FtsL [Hirschia litorea]|uniref:Cell division protein FtsL n=1 Tax=Hirschia litorea TaxID=1199156 RepID=A0ABW2ILA7_9PROT